MDTLSGAATVKIVLPSFWNGVYSTRKEFAPFGSKFIPCRLDSFSELGWCAGKQTGSRKSSFLYKNDGKSAICVLITHL